MSEYTSIIRTGEVFNFCSVDFFANKLVRGKYQLDKSRHAASAAISAAILEVPSVFKAVDSSDIWNASQVVAQYVFGYVGDLLNHGYNPIVYLHDDIMLDVCRARL